MNYAILMKDGSTRTMTIFDPAATVEQEIAKWTDAADVVSFYKEVA